MMHRRNTNKVFFSSAAALWLMAMAGVLVCPSPFAEGVVSCVNCGWEEAEPCGRTLPQATECEGEKETCFTGVYVNMKTGRVWETRRCSQFNSGKYENGLLSGVLCDTDNCNYDRSGERRTAPMLPDPQKVQCPPPEDNAVTVTGGPLECVQCGGNGTDGREPCGADLPEPTPCEAKHKSCGFGIYLNKMTGLVRELRECVTTDKIASYTYSREDHQFFSALCRTTGCNVDAERLYSDSACPTPPPPAGNSATRTVTIAASLCGAGVVVGLVIVSRFNAACW